jgi:catechol 2,3-dioxygenase-like lactoylglutathione lyase family enzyme
MDAPIDHITLAAANLERALAFYRDGLWNPHMPPRT